MFDNQLEALPLPELEAEVCSWASRISAATSHWLSVITIFDQRKGWAKAGMPSCAHWLSWRCGIGLRASYEYLRVARALQALPHLREVFGNGAISYSKVRAVTRIATAETERRWVSEALRYSARRLERLVTLQLKIDAEKDKDGGNGGGEVGNEDPSHCSWRWNDDGTFSLNLVLDATRGAVMCKALELAESGIEEEKAGRASTDSDNSAQIRPQGDNPKRKSARRRAEAATAMAATFLAQGLPALADPIPYMVNVHVDIHTLTGASDSARRARSEQESKEKTTRRVCELEGGAILPPSIARQLSCDSILQTILTDAGGNPLALGRSRRRPTTKLRRAIYARDGGVCQYPGCRHHKWLQIHHMLEWEADDGATDPANLILICSMHHRLIHDRSLVLRRGPDGELLVFWQDGTVLRDAPAMATTRDPLRAFERFTAPQSGYGPSTSQAA